MKRKIITTGDGSTTIHIAGWNEQYHSKHGAINEAYHVFIDNGLALLEGQRPVSILEIGFGTGLNAFVTFLEAEKRGLTINYTGIEAYPVAESEWRALNYPEQLGIPDYETIFEHLHKCLWEESHAITSFFNLTKQQKKFQELTGTNNYNLIYFDAFGARVQPELWTEAIFAIMYRALRPGGILVTYAAKGSVRRAMQVVGFIVERLPGPPGKREMLRARKIT
ncbi:tRNA (5-methylaminomethyl-2-thiouridine)(34)-methyltransferase MnmD [Leptobacterium sp. I13]|uniref:tRNA (5-methylaminomethyl-2-thiouridine)(34)-methyltransferase MnmD n=1 Tax=Leptobacterium meishanense TaxID=3128904 RepID=UPI0030EBADB3